MYGHWYVASTSNQRIQAWWSSFRKSRSEWWIGLFKDLTALGAFSPGNLIQTYCVRYCFMDILQKELDFVATTWNEHLIRGSTMSECPSGIPDELFFLSETSGTVFGWVYQPSSFWTTRFLKSYLWFLKGRVCYNITCLDFTSVFTLNQSHLRVT